MNTEQSTMKDDFELLDLMLGDSNSQAPLYRPGPYWAAKAQYSANEIKRCGLSDFRGSTNLIGLSYADNLFIDVRDSLNHGFKKRFARLVTKTYPLSLVFDAQVHWTKSYANQSIRYAEAVLNLKERTRSLLKRYKVPYSLLGNSLAKARIDGQEYSVHYLNLLEQHDNIAARIDFSLARSVFEIGGGFGINVHLLLENYKNIRKVLYLDIPPNLYVGTQYLKAFYGTAVSDYRDLKGLDRITFSENDDLEIYCVAPWQIENVRSTANIFMNAHSFVEMPVGVVRNYMSKFRELPETLSSRLAFTAYDGFDLNTTFDPAELPKFMEDRQFECFDAETLLDSTRKNLFYVSPGKFARVSPR